MSRHARAVLLTLLMVVSAFAGPAAAGLASHASVADGPTIAADATGVADGSRTATANDSVSRVAFDYADYGGTLNLEVNGDRRVVDHFYRAPPDGVDGATVGGATVTVRNRTADGLRGTVVVAGEIDSFSVGGQELVVDNVAFGDASAPRANVTFDNVTPGGTSFAVNDSLTADGVDATVEPFVLADGSRYYRGSGRVQNSSTFTADAGRPDFYPGNVNLRFDVASVAASDGGDGGDGDEPFDVGIELEQSETVRRGGSANVSAFVNNRATTALSNATVELRVDADADGRHEADEVVTGRTASVAADSIAEVVLTYRNVSLPAGNYTYQARVRAAGGEATSFTNGTLTVVGGSAAGNATVSRVAFDYGQYGGNLNLEVNGDVVTDVGRFDAAPPDGVDGATLGGASVSVASTATSSGRTGHVEITGDVRSFSVGGQELWLDDVEFGDAASPDANVTFDSVTPAQSRYVVNDSLTADGVDVAVEAFTWTDGTVYAGGFGRVSNSTTTTAAGAALPDFNTNNVNLRFDVASAAASPAAGGACRDVTTSGHHALSGDVTNSTARYCINVTASDVVLDGRGHTVDGVGATLGSAAEPPVGVHVDGAENVTIRNLTVAEWQTGVVYRNASGRLDGVDVRRADLDGVRVDGSDVAFANGTVTAGDDGFQVENGATLDATRTTVDDGGGATALQRGVRVTNRSTAALRDAVVADAAVTGVLVNVRSTGDVVDSELRDSEVGIALSSTSQADVVGTNVTNSGSDGLAVSFDSDLVLQDSRVVDSGTAGVRVDESSASVDDTRVEGFGAAGVLVTAGTDASRVAVHGSDLVDAGGGFGVENRNGSATYVNATGNYWGAADGPSSDGAGELGQFAPFTDPVTGAPANGSGTAVTSATARPAVYGSSNVHFDPFLNASAAGANGSDGGDGEDGGDGGDGDAPFDVGIELEQSETVRRGGSANVSAFVNNRATTALSNATVELRVDADADGRHEADEVVTSRRTSLAADALAEVVLAYRNVSLPAGNYTYQARVRAAGGEATSFTNGTLTVEAAPRTLRTARVVLAGAPNGVGSYEVRVDAGVGAVTSVEGPANATLANVSAGGVGETTVTYRAAFDSFGPTTANVTLLTVGYSEPVTRADLAVRVRTLLDRNATPIDPARVSLRVEPTTPFPEGVPGVSGRPPTDLDGDAQLEDLDGDGDSDLDDAFALAFEALPRAGGFSADQVAALDFDGDGSLGLGDVFALAFGG